MVAWKRRRNCMHTAHGCGARGKQRCGDVRSRRATPSTHLADDVDLLCKVRQGAWGRLLDGGRHHGAATTREDVAAVDLAELALAQHPPELDLAPRQRSILPHGAVLVLHEAELHALRTTPCRRAPPPVFQPHGGVPEQQEQSHPDRATDSRDNHAAAAVLAW